MKKNEKIAIKLKNINGHQILWEVLPRIEGHKYIVTSASDVQFSCIDTWTAHSEGVNALAFGPDDTLITGGTVGYIRSWKRSGKTKLLQEFPAHRGVIYDLLV